MNIMIIIFIFKAGWYNEWLDRVLKAGMPVDRCPAGTNAGFVGAQSDLSKKWVAEATSAYLDFGYKFAKFHNVWCKAKTGDLKIALPATNSWTTLAEASDFYSKNTFA